MNGFICVDKPGGPTSFAVVAQVKRQLKISKAGHCGTLDPNASGLLILALGKATRLIPCLSLEPKIYEFDITFGAQTDTLDPEGSIIKENEKIPEENELRAVIPDFTGRIEQTPPRYSAIKIKGKRAFALAREGKEFDLPRRTVSIFSLTLDTFDQSQGIAQLTVSCSSGTYVRSLARDIAEKLGTCGYASSIKRTGMGRYSVKKAVTPDRITAENTDYIISISEMLDDLPRIFVDRDQVKALSNGQDLSLPVKTQNGKPVLAMDEESGFVALLTPCDANKFHPDIVIK
ncbi:MAG: tRNA pseudouridine(55) synthase TruB [Chitinivibrionales bacterium]|nr:tRNA pseudouridine(55) synthase TruB [Chitinivibrionales bacterium]